jgi:hypothetical protein
MKGAPAVARRFSTEANSRLLVFGRKFTRFKTIRFAAPPPRQPPNSSREGLEPWSRCDEQETRSAAARHLLLVSANLQTALKKGDPVDTVFCRLVENPTAIKTDRALGDVQFLCLVREMISFGTGNNPFQAPCRRPSSSI